MTDFSVFVMTGGDTDKFLQGQITADMGKIGTAFVPTAICNLKGRVQFGLWVRRVSDNADDGVQIVISSDLAEDLAKHIKKFGAFSKITLSAAKPIYPAIIDGVASFDTTDHDQTAQWQALSIATGNYWITKDTSELYQPQELRLHQRDGVAYDKGCYLGQEIVARLYFKASPKAYLHRVASADVDFFAHHVEESGLAVVNSISSLDGSEALVVARPDTIETLGATQSLQNLPLPDALQADVGRV